MAKDDNIRLEGIVTKVLPSSMYKVEIETGGEKRTLLCHQCGKMKMNSIILTTGDRVSLEVSPYDMTKGRITYRLKS